MNVIYLGTPDFAVKPLMKIVESQKYNVIAVVTNKDKPVGRKQILTACPVKQYAISKGIKVLQYEKIRLEGVSDIKDLKPDLMITCAFGQILSKELLDIPKFGTINIHASLLPKYRGASPIHFAILNGEKETGVTIMKTDEGIDTGDVLIKKSIKIEENENCGELFEELSNLGSDMIIDALNMIESGTAVFTKQDDKEATYSKIIKKEMAKIDWSKSNFEVVNKIRAFNPSPVAYTMLDGEMFKIYSAVSCDKNGEAGAVISNDKELVVGCGSGSIKLLKVQKAGGKPLDILDFLRGNTLPIGLKFTND